MNNFVYDIPTKVYFGKDQLSHLGEELKKFGNRVLLTYGGGSIKRIGLYDAVVAEIEKAGLELLSLILVLSRCVQAPRCVRSIRLTLCWQ